MNSTERGNQIAFTYLGLDGKPVLLSSGIATLRSVFNEQGKETRVNYYGIRENRPCTATAIMPGSGVRRSGNALVTTFLGLDGKPTWVAAGYARLKSTYDNRGRKTRQSFYGADGQPTLHRDGNHAWESQYYERVQRNRHHSL